MNKEEISLSFEINEENKKVIDFLREEAKNQYWFTIENEHGERLDIVEKEKYDLLQQENKKYKEVFDKLKEYIWRTEINSIGTPLACITIGKELLDILKEVENERNS